MPSVVRLNSWYALQTFHTLTELFSSFFFSFTRVHLYIFSHEKGYKIIYYWKLNTTSEWFSEKESNKNDEQAQTHPNSKMTWTLRI